MTAEELFAYLDAPSDASVDRASTCDTVKCGDASVTVTRAAVSMFATPDVIRQASAWGAQVLIVHEPTYYDHFDRDLSSPIAQRKQAFAAQSGLVIRRFHDHAHARVPDLIFQGEIEALGLAGKAVGTPYYAVTRYQLDRSITARELAKRMESVLGLHHVRIAGDLDAEGSLLSCAFGTPGHIAEELLSCDFVLTGEICEWREGEMARDMAQLGDHKALLVMSHIGSERAGMMLLARQMQSDLPAIETRYFECGELYHYSEEKDTL